MPGLIVKLLGTIVSLAAIAAAIWGLDYLLFEPSLQIIKDFSRHWSTSFFADFMLSYTSVGVTVLVGIVSVWAVKDGPKIQQIMFGNAVLLSMVLCPFFKIVCHKLRPCWVDEDILIITTEKDYGSPSGHTANCAAFTFAGLLLYWQDNLDFALTQREREILTARKRSCFYSKRVKIVLSALLLAAYGLIAFSRFYLGAHTLDQILSGFFLGLFSVLLVFCYFRTTLVGFYKRLLKVGAGCPRDCDLSVIVAGSALLFVLANLLWFVVLQLNDVHIDEAMVKRIQTHIPEFRSDTPLSYGLLYSAFALTFTGLHCGLIVAGYCPKVDPTRLSLPCGFWKPLIRLVVCGLITAGVPLLLFLLVPLYPTMYYCWLKAALPSAMASFLYFAFGDLIALKMHLLPEHIEPSLALPLEASRDTFLEKTVVQSKPTP